MKFIAIELSAIDEIVGGRFLQSVEFDQGKDLAALIAGQLKSVMLGSKIVITEAGEGLFLTGLKLERGARFLVIDVQQSDVFRLLSDSDCLFVFQKMLRFAKKIWQGLTMNFSEKIISNSTKAVLFPFRNFKPTPFRVVIDRDPSPERLARRGDKGNFMLVYKSGFEGGDASREVAELTNFRKAYEAVAEVRRTIRQRGGELHSAVPVADQLQVMSLPDTAVVSSGTMYRHFEGWEPLLTRQQKEFIFEPISGPYRIEGPAGTGKTLSLILKAVASLRAAKEETKEFHAVFVTHSDATRRTIEEVLGAVDQYGFANAERGLASQSLKVCTLSELCAEQLRQSISESEFIDRDAMESKGLQLLYIGEALKEAMVNEFAAHERFLTAEFSAFLKKEDHWKVVEMLQHEISVVIKGRASEDFDKYKKVHSLRYGLPVRSDADKGFVFAVFRLYQSQLGQVGQFDTDDIVLTTIGQLDTPIWRRRRTRDGFDALFVDETHLFNINELHLFHYFSKKEGPYPIIYSVDRSQAVGDRGWTTQDIASSLTFSSNEESEAKVKTIFRSSVDIVNLAFSIVSSGATLFTNFDNPIDVTASAFTEAEERLSAPPVYYQVPNEDALIEAAFGRVDQLHKELGCRRSDILIVTLDEKLLNRLQEFAATKNKPHLLLKKRGDTSAVESARQSSQLVLAHADYVGGLEFQAVVLVGVDGGRVPPGEEGSESSKNYLSYASHNRLYVAVTRARYRVEMLGEKARGPSKIIEPAIAAGVLNVDEYGA